MVLWYALYGSLGVGVGIGDSIVGVGSGETTVGVGMGDAEVGVGNGDATVGVTVGVMVGVGGMHPTRNTTVSIARSFFIIVSLLC